VISESGIFTAEDARLVKSTGKSTNSFVQLLNKPGMWLQNFTTCEPDNSQIEVAIVALKNVMVENKELDRW
jgi:uncharacterized protein YqhQ